MPSNGELITLGTLYAGGTTYAMPTNPVDGGNCVNYNGTDITIGSTVSGKALQWRYFEKSDGTKLLICDRVLIRSVTWNNLNSANVIFGKEVTIDGQKYTLRSLTGSTGASGTNGAGTANEWDQMMDAIGESNDIWHWSNMYTWCQETYYNNSSSRSFRGYGSARSYDYSGATYCITYIGWRPALEILNTAPLISDSDGDLGSYAAPLTKTYTVSEADGENFSILEKLDGTTIRSLTNQSAGSFTIDLTSRWTALTKASHTLTVTATDPNGAASTRTWTFTKTNTPCVAPTINTPASGSRVAQTVDIVFTPVADADGDNQYFVVQVANNAAFTSGLTSFSSGLKKLVDGVWTSCSYAAAADIGKQFKLTVSGLSLNTTKYVRVSSRDTNGSGLYAYSSAITVRVGDTLEIKTLPENWAYRPEYAYPLLEATIASGATVQIFVCNNANDASPTWENCTTAWQNQQTYAFTNTTKTATSWAVSTKVIITAGAATGEISVSAIGQGVS